MLKNSRRRAGSGGDDPDGRIALGGGESGVGVVVDAGVLGVGRGLAHPVEAGEKAGGELEVDVVEELLTGVPGRGWEDVEDLVDEVPVAGSWPVAVAAAGVFPGVLERRLGGVSVGDVEVDGVLEHGAPGGLAEAGGFLAQAGGPGGGGARCRRGGVEGRGEEQQGCGKQEGGESHRGTRYAGVAARVKPCRRA